MHPRSTPTLPTLIEVRDLAVQFRLIDGTVPGVSGVHLQIKRGQTLGVVGESGSGKTVTALSILRLMPSPPSELVGGSIMLHRRDAPPLDLLRLAPDSAQIRAIRGSEIAMIFQEPMTSLTPAYTVGEQIMEAVMLHQNIGRAEAHKRATEMLGRVGMPQPARIMSTYPHQLSGGMLQRAMIALALSCNPDLLIADEPTTALDVTTSAQILDLMQELQSEFGMAIMYISHDLGVIAEMADEVAVMYLGRIVEHAAVQTLFDDPKHPYTQGLLNSIPRWGRRQRLEPIRGTVPEPRAIPKGCPFSTRCPHFMPTICDAAVPPLVSVGPQHEVRCYLHGGIPAASSMQLESTTS
jgi:oligopeptide/dipeptide ABC transporter ATP-binding protein